MTQQRPATTPTGEEPAARPLSRAFDPALVDVTDIIPFNEFGDLHELDFSEHAAFDTGSQVMGSPALDDLHDIDDLAPLRLAVPAEFAAKGDKTFTPSSSS